MNIRKQTAGRIFELQVPVQSTTEKERINHPHMER